MFFPNPFNAKQLAGQSGLTPEARQDVNVPGAVPKSAGSVDGLSLIPFQNAEGCRAILGHACAAVSPALAAALPALVEESPDPDSAIILFDRLVSESPDIELLLEQNHFLAHYAIVVFGHSRFLGETLIQNTDLLHSFLRERNLDLSFSHDDFQENLSRFRSRSFESDISLLLARFKRREYVRIMLRDVLKIAPLSETTAEISALADVLIAEALREAESCLQRRYGTARHLDVRGRLVDTRFAVLSLGKLGGNELNYASDVDLMYMFDDGTDASEAAISNREYFIRLSQQVTATLSGVTREGPVFRIDLRLRPQGYEGEVAIGMETALRYYKSNAHDWERQALIKIRHSAGNIALAREFIRRVQPEVYGKAGIGERTDGDGEETPSIPAVPGSGLPQPFPVSYGTAGRLNFAAIKTALVSRQKIQQRGRKKPPRGETTINVKLDSGGIRDIEFLVQCLQRVHGTAEPWLRSGGTLFSLQKLHDKGHISGKEFHDLSSAYEFLRHLEHRIQLRHGQQTAQLPEDVSELKILRRSMEGYDPQEYRIADLVAAVQRRMAAVAEIYRQVIYQHQTRSHADTLNLELKLSSLSSPSRPDQSSQQIMERLAEDMPEVHRIAYSNDLSPAARKNLFRFLGAALNTSHGYAEAIRHQAAVIRALPLFNASEYLTDVLVRHPEDIVTVGEIGESIPRVDSGYLFASPLGQGRAAMDPVFEYIAGSRTSYAEKMSLLRRQFRHRILAVGARDIHSLCGVYQSMDSITAAAEDVISAAVAMAGNPEGLAIMAVGRLGSRELDVLSDVDLLFVADREGDRERLTKCAEQIMNTLSAYTCDGMVFPVDTRLRPHGSAGELLVTPVQLSVYFAHEAQAWEALMYTKLRFIAGTQALGDRVMSLAGGLFQHSATDPNLRKAVLEMRDKLSATNSGEMNFKTAPGASYDIDFATGFLLLKHSIPTKQGSLRDRLWRCAALGVLENADAAALDHAAEFFRTVEHLVRLSVGRTQKWLPATEHARQVCEILASRILKTQFSDGLEAEMLRTMSTVRNIYDRVMQTRRN